MSPALLLMCRPPHATHPPPTPPASGLSTRPLLPTRPQHHIQFGYYLQGAAAVGKADPAWLAANRDLLLNVLRDYANPRTGRYSSSLSYNRVHAGGPGDA